MVLFSYMQQEEKGKHLIKGIWICRIITLGIFMFLSDFRESLGNSSDYSVLLAAAGKILDLDCDGLPKQSNLKFNTLSVMDQMC